MEPPGKSLTGKTILVVNAGNIQKSFTLKRMKELGVRIIALHHREEEWAKNTVDHWIITPKGRQKGAMEAVRQFQKKTDMQIDGATTFWEEEIPLLAELCQEFHWIGNSIETSLNTRSKFAMQETLRRTGRPHIRQKFLRSKGDLREAIAHIGFPAIIKPLFGTDSISVIYIRTEQEAETAYERVMESGLQAYEVLYQYEKGLFVYQEYIDGPEFSVECYCQNGSAHAIAIHEKTSMTLPFFVETGDYIPPRITPEKERALMEEATASITALGIQNSIAHVELKLSNCGPQVIEVASRMGGYYTHHTVHGIYGFDLVKTACEIAVGLPVSDVPTPPMMYVAGHFFIPSISGVITSIEGMDILREPFVLDSYLFKKTGERIAVPPDGYETVGWFLVKGTSHSDVTRNVEHILQHVHIVVEPKVHSKEQPSLVG